MVPLGEILELRYGKALKAEDRSNSGFAVIGSGGITGHHATPFVTGPTIVVGRKGSIGSLTYAPDGCWPIDTAYFVQLKQEVNLRWLYWSMQLLHLDSMNKSAAVPGLNRDDAYRARLPLPPLPEQRRIAAILDEADALRTTAVTATERVDDARAAQFEHLFPSATEDLTTIGALIESTQYGTSGKAGGTGRFPILRMSNLTARGRIDLRDMKYIDIPDQEVEKYLVRKGDVLFNRTNSAELVGKTAVYREDVPRVYAGYLVRLRASDEVIAEYIAGYLNSVHGKRTLRRMAKSIVGMANINAREVQTIRLPAPSAEKLHAYKAFVDESWSNTARLESRARELDSLFASLQHRAFRGEL